MGEQQTPSTTDLVVVLPGITGSTLLRAGNPVWAVTPGTLIEAITHLGRHLAVLQLPEGIGDEHPGDGVEPGQLMPTLHGIPGVWTPIKGYTELLDHLRGLGYREPTGDQPGNLLAIPYDWRLSNRYTARRVKAVVEPALARWRARGGRYADARLVFVCHSMGGLIARWYIEMEGGAEITRKLITLGTPYRGAAKALAQLVNGAPRKLGRLAPDLTPLIRSFPSMYQLTPEYACITHGRDLLKTAETTLPDLNTTMATDAAAFHTALTTAEHARGDTVHAITHAIVGIRQTSTTTLTPTPTGLDERSTYQAEQLYGDGTVPLPGAVRHGLPLDTPLIKRIADKHGNLQRNQAALDEIEGILTGHDVNVRATTPLQPHVDTPELLTPDEPIPVTIDLGANHGIRLTLRNEHGTPIDTLTPRPHHGTATATFDPQPPGGYTIDLTGLAPASPITPISSDLIIWPPQT
ncbi:MAG: hypothetical protein IPG94_16020 [Kineosporiaceae bacterium]|nr:hypothetical protein [Kineosporiaceae bacterium]